MVISPVILNLDRVQLSDEQFYQLCQNNQELKFERNTQGELTIMSPVGGESGNRESELMIDLGIWNRQTKLGYTFSSSTIFKLPNGADRSPDAAWIKKRTLGKSHPRTTPEIPPPLRQIL